MVQGPPHQVRCTHSSASPGSYEANWILFLKTSSVSISCMLLFSSLSFPLTVLVCFLLLRWNILIKMECSLGLGGNLFIWLNVPEGQSPLVMGKSKKLVVHISFVQEVEREGAGKWAWTVQYQSLPQWSPSFSKSLPPEGSRTFSLLVFILFTYFHSSQRFSPIYLLGFEFFSSFHQVLNAKLRNVCLVIWWPCAYYCSAKLTEFLYYLCSF